MAGRKDLIQAFRDRAGLTVRESALCVDALAEWIEETLVSGRRIELRGLGTFTVKKTGEKKTDFSNARKGVIPAHGRIVFRPFKRLKQAVWGIKT